MFTATRIRLALSTFATTPHHPLDALTVMGISTAEFIAMESRVAENHRRGINKQKQMDALPHVRALARKVEREADLHNAIIDYCKSKGWLYIHSAMHTATHQTVGTPDFIIAADYGRVFWVEAKVGKNKQSTAQLAIEAWLHKLGHCYHIVRSIEEFIEVTK